jgi:hypothetical protein
MHTTRPCVPSCLEFHTHRDTDTHLMYNPPASRHAAFLCRRISPFLKIVRFHEPRRPNTCERISLAGWLPLPLALAWCCARRPCCTARHAHPGDASKLGSGSFTHCEEGYVDEDSLNQNLKSRRGGQKPLPMLSDIGLESPRRCPRFQRPCVFVSSSTIVTRPLGAMLTEGLYLRRRVGQAQSVCRRPLPLTHLLRYVWFAPCPRSRSAFGFGCNTRA